MLTNKIDAVFIGRRYGWPVFRIIQVGVEILRSVGHVIGHQVDIIEQGRYRLHVHPVFRTFRIRTDGNGHQFLIADGLTQFLSVTV